MFVSHPDRAKRLSIRAIVDSGSSLTALPLRVLKSLGAPVYDRLDISGYDNRLSKMPTYIVAIEIVDQFLWPLEVVGLTRDVAILGRDVLNQFVVALDGPALTFEMHLPPKT